MTEPGRTWAAWPLLPPSVLALGILAAAAIVSRGASLGAWWTLHAGAVVVGVSVIIGAALVMNRSAYPPLAILAAALLFSLALLVSASIVGDPARGPMMIPIWGSGGGFSVLLVPRSGSSAARSPWNLVGASALLAAGVVLAAVILSP